MAPSAEFGVEKMNPTQKINNKVEGTPKPETKKVKFLIHERITFDGHQSVFFFFLKSHDILPSSVP